MLHNYGQKDSKLRDQKVRHENNCFGVKIFYMFYIFMFFLNDLTAV